MACQRCKSKNILDVSAKCSDCFTASFKDAEYNGYVLSDLNIGDGDYLEFKLCLSCGQIQAEFPISDARIEELQEEMHVS